MKLVSHPTVAPLLQDERLMKLFMTALSVPGRLDEVTAEQKANFSRMMGLAATKRSRQPQAHRSRARNRPRTAAQPRADAGDSAPPHARRRRLAHLHAASTDFDLKPSAVESSNGRVTHRAA